MGSHKWSFIPTIWTFFMICASLAWKRTLLTLEYLRPPEAYLEERERAAVITNKGRAVWPPVNFRGGHKWYVSVKEPPRHYGRKTHSPAVGAHGRDARPHRPDIRSASRQIAIRLPPHLPCLRFGSIAWQSVHLSKDRQTISQYFGPIYTYAQNPVTS